MKELEVNRRNVIDNLYERNINYHELNAIEYFGTHFSYYEMFHIIDSYARSFRNIGVKSNDVVTLCLAGTPEAIFCFYAINKIGAIANFVNPNYFQMNGCEYIDKTNSRVMVILDRFYLNLKKEIERTSVEKIIVSTLDYYATEIDKYKTGDSFFFKMKKSQIIDGFEYFDINQFLNCGKNSENVISEPYIENKKAAIFYTSGTTGNPKGVVITNDGLNNMISMYDAMNGMGRVPGDKNLVIIPSSYATGMIHCINSPFAFGVTNILQPIYDKNMFAKDLKKYRPNVVTATASHYARLMESDLKVGELDFLKYPCTGGEGLTKEFAIEMSSKLMYYGAKEPLIMGYGMSELGCMAMINHGIENRTSEAGKPMPYVKVRIIDPKTGMILGPNERGEVQIITPCIMDGYFENDSLTQDFFAKDENEEKWARTGDIGSYNQEGIYSIDGRLSNSFVDQNGSVIYLFDYIKVIAKFHQVLESEVVAVTINNKKLPVVHLVLKKEYSTKASEIIFKINYELCKLFPFNPPYCYKLRKDFPISSISAKRDPGALVHENKGFLMIREGKIYKTDILLDEIVLNRKTNKAKTMSLNLKK